MKEERQRGGVFEGRRDRREECLKEERQKGGVWV